MKVAHDLFKDYLCDRLQYVCVNGNKGGTLPIVYGVPQGSCLGLTLFLLYINDIGSLNLKGKTFLYADDTSIFYAGSSADENVRAMNSDLAVLSDYFSVNLLTLSRDKTKYIHFRNKNTRIDQSIDVRIGNDIIESVQQITYLGLILDTNLS